MSLILPIPARNISKSQIVSLSTLLLCWRSFAGAQNLTHFYVANDPNSDTKTFFGADWDMSSEDLNALLNDYVSSCESLGCFIDNSDGLCQCPVAEESIMVFHSTSELMSCENILSKATFGAFLPTSEGLSLGNGVTMYPSGPLSKETVFECIDQYGQKSYRKNIASRVAIGNGGLAMRNPVTFFTLSEYTKRDAEYELDAALNQYFYHPNTGEFFNRKFQICAKSAELSI